jgi:hypothetical protein
MSKAISAFRWFALRRAADRPRNDDPADMGTTFGLELILREQVQSPAPLPSRSRWIHKFAVHRKSAV